LDGIKQMEAGEKLKRGKRLPAALRENKRLSVKIKEYKKRIKAGDFNLKIEFETEPSQLQQGELIMPVNDVTVVMNEYEIVWLDIDKLVHRNVSKPHLLFPKDRLWVIRSPLKMARLIEFIEAGNKLLPPIIEPLGRNEDVVFIDGNHRIALFRFLKLSKAPFLVKKKHIPFIDALKQEPLMS
jgi:hypothetical protein